MKSPERIEKRGSWKSCLAGFGLVFGLSLISTACSPGLFFGDNSKDRAVSEATGYRKINTACSGMELASPLLDVPTFRKLVSCFNSNGALEPVQKLVDRLSNEDVQALVDLQNKYLLSNSKLIYQFDQTYRTLERRKELDEAFRQFGRIIENEEFVASGIAVLKDKYLAGKSGSLLKAFEELSKKIDPGTFADALDLGLTLAESRAFSSLQDHFRNPSFEAILPLMSDFISYLGEAGDPHHVHAGRELIEAILRSHLLEALDKTMGVNPGELKHNLTRTTAVLKAMLKDNGELAGELASLFHFLHKAPIACLEGSKEVSDGVMHVIRELSEFQGSDPAEYIRRTNKLQLVTLKPFCAYPSELQRYYGAIEKLADTSAIGPTAELMRALYQETRPNADGSVSRPLAELLANLLADTGSGGGGGPAENTAGIRKLIPLLVELDRRDAWDDLLLTASLLRLEDRPRLKSALEFLVRPVPAMKGQSVYDVLTNTLVNASPRLPRLLAELVFSIRRFTEARGPILGPAFKILRSAFYVNDVHPVVGLLHDLMADASKNERIFDLLFRISEMQEFRDSIRLFSRMAQDDRLKDLVGSLMTLFSKFGQEGRMEIHPVVEPGFDPDSRRRHNLAAADLMPFPLETHPPSSSGELACRRLSFDISLADYGKPGFAEQIPDMVSCLNAHGGYDSVEKAIQFLRESKTEGNGDYLGYSVGLVQDLNLDREKAGFLIDRWLEAYRDGRFNRILDGIGYWISPGSLKPGLDSLIEPLLALASPIMAKEPRESLDRLQSFGAQVVRRDAIPSILGLVDDLLDVHSPVSTPADPERYDLARISKWVKGKECGKQRNSTGRAAEIVDEYQKAVTSWEVLPNGHPPREWSYDDFSKKFQSLLKILADPDFGGGARARSGGSGRTFDAILRFSRYFNLAAGEAPGLSKHYSPDRLVEWVRERANDHKLITYYYPGDTQPRVRMVSTLDRLELVLINADFNAPLLGTNFGLKFLADIADAWGDEPEAIWPEAIRRKARSGEKIQTLAEVVQNIDDTQKQMEGLLGFPSLPKCYHVDDPKEQDPDGGGVAGWLPGLGDIRPNIYNIHEVVSVLKENVDNGGLRILRDLFFEFHSTSSKDGQSATTDANHLSAILKMVRMGIFREVGRNIKLVSDEDLPALRALFATLLEGARTQGVHDLFDALLVRDPQFGLILKVVEQAFASLDDSSASTFKQLLFYLMADVSSLGITEPVVTDLAAIVGQDREFLKAHVDLLGPLFKSATLSDLVRALYEDSGWRPEKLEARHRLAELLKETLGDPERGLDLVRVVRAVSEDKGATAAWDVFRARLDALKADEGYRNLHLGEILEDVLKFFEERSDRPGSAQVARHLREYLARRMEGRDLDQLLLLASSDQKRTYQFLQTLAGEVQNGDLKRFFDLIQRSVFPPKK